MSSLIEWNSFIPNVLPYGGTRASPSRGSGGMGPHHHKTQQRAIGASVVSGQPTRAAIGDVKRRSAQFSLNLFGWLGSPLVAASVLLVADGRGGVQVEA